MLVFNFNSLLFFSLIRLILNSGECADFFCLVSNHDAYDEASEIKTKESCGKLKTISREIRCFKRFNQISLLILKILNIFSLLTT